MPVTEIFEAEIDVLDLLEYKPIISRGYNCVMHIHTWADEITIKDIVKSIEVDKQGKEVVKDKPQFAKGQTKIICRIAPRTQVSLEKFETINQLGRFTLRDEGKTIAVGKVLKYKPSAKAAATIKAAQTQKAGVEQVTNQMGQVTVAAKEDMVYDMETGEMRPAKKQMDVIAEGDEE
jgi:hypothetical protein